jgi:hypothetical protein
MRLCCSFSIFSKQWAAYASTDTTLMDSGAILLAGKRRHASLTVTLCVHSSLLDIPFFFYETIFAPIVYFVTLRVREAEGGVQHGDAFQRKAHVQPCGRRFS